MDFRPDFPAAEMNRLRAPGPQRHDPARPGELRRRLQPDALAARPRFPGRYHDKVRVIFDGIDTGLWRPIARPARADSATASIARRARRSSPT